MHAWDYRFLWYKMPHDFPTDQQSVYVRRHYFSRAFLATWDLASQTFATSTGLVIPWYHIARWRIQFYV
jgi:hypothetical protein